MPSWLINSRALLEQITLKALRENVAHNRSALPPFRLPKIAQQIIQGLADFLKEAVPSMAIALGENLGSQGLGLRSLLAVTRTAFAEVSLRPSEAESSNPTLAPAPAPAPPATLARLNEFFTYATDGLASYEMTAVSRQRDEIQVALERVLKAREEKMIQVIRELSTPVIPVHEHVLVLPIIGSIDAERARRITECLLQEVTRRRAQIIIIDLTGVPESDASALEALLRTARAAALLGARTVFVGIRPEMARALAKFGADRERFFALADLQSGIGWALRELGLTIERLPASSLRSTSSTQALVNGGSHHGD